MTTADFKAYTDAIVRLVLVVGSMLLFWRALELAKNLPNDTLFVSLASGGAMAILLGVYSFWFGNAHKSPPPPDTTTVTTTDTKQ